MSKSFYKEIIKYVIGETLLQVGFEKSTENNFCLLSDVFLYFVDILCSSISEIQVLIYDEKFVNDNLLCESRSLLLIKKLMYEFYYDKQYEFDELLQFLEIQTQLVRQLEGDDKNGKLSVLELLKIIPAKSKLKMYKKSVKLSITDQHIRDEYLFTNTKDVELKKNATTEKDDLDNSEFFNKFIQQTENLFNDMPEKTYQYSSFDLTKAIVSKSPSDIEKPEGIKMINWISNLNEEEQKSIFKDFGPCKYKIFKKL